MDSEETKVIGKVIIQTFEHWFQWNRDIIFILVNTKVFFLTRKINDLFTPDFIRHALQFLELNGLT
jgi:hypothetical protein